MKRRRCRRLTPAERDLVYAPIEANAGLGWSSRGGDAGTDQAPARGFRREPETTAELDPDRDLRRR